MINIQQDKREYMDKVLPVFSIITVTYNAERVLERTILNVVEQSYPNIEYIIIDGKSKDGTVGIIRQYANRLSYWISEQDEGLYHAMNKGIEKATGDYVMFLNAGDMLQGRDCITQLAHIAEENCWPDVLYGETDIVDENGTFLGPRRLKAPENLNWRSFRMGMLVCHQAFIVKRAIAPLYDLSYRYSADFDWCIRCMKAGESITNSHLRLVNYLNEGLTTTNRKASLKERYHIMQKYYGKIPVALLHIWFAIRFYWAKLIKGIV